MPKGAKSRSDISNTAMRVFLQKVGATYDYSRGFEPFLPTPSQMKEVAEFFSNCCCYCAKPLGGPTEVITTDHLIPQNKEHLGLHAWGNVVPCCALCNKEKRQIKWQNFLKQKCTEAAFPEREKRIQSFVNHYRYDPNLELKAIASNLYQDVGAVAMTLIDLRFKQAEAVIARLHHISAP